MLKHRRDNTSKCRTKCKLCFFARNQYYTRIDNNGCLPKTWTLLDNQSTVDIFCSKDLFHAIRKTIVNLNILSNTRVTATELVGDPDQYSGITLNEL